MDGYGYAVACGVCGAKPNRAGGHPYTRPDPQRTSCVIVLCDDCAHLEPRHASELILKRRAYFDTRTLTRMRGNPR